ncbi:MAG: SIR2 family protein [Verrucomicrobiota bacterium]
MQSHVYVFGAGASAAEPLCAPVMSAFLKRGFDLLYSVTLLESQGKSNTHFPKSSFWKVAEMLDRLFKSNLAGEITDLVSQDIEYARQNRMVLIHGGAPIRRIPLGATIEDLLTFAELNEEDSEWHKYRQPLRDFVFVTLDSALDPKRSSSSTYTPQGVIRTPLYCYDHFVAKRVDPRNRNVFISFNYDEFLDRALWLADTPLPADYNLSFTHVDQWDQYEAMMLHDGHHKKAADLLKLHGSTNWARCSQCDGLHLFSFRHYVAMLKEPCKRCKRADAFLTPVLVPPTFRKDIKRYGIDAVWNKAEQALVSADHITIIGYSFPDADLEAKWLFKRAIAYSGKTPTLTVVDPSPAVHEKIAGLFGNTVSKIQHLPNFESYVAMTDVKMNSEFPIEAFCKDLVEEITTQVQQAVSLSGIMKGECKVFVPHQHALLTRDGVTTMNSVSERNLERHCLEFCVRDGCIQHYSGARAFIHNLGEPRTLRVSVSVLPE